jgi:hypothetical protein
MPARRLKSPSKNRHPILFLQLSIQSSDYEKADSLGATCSEI